MEKADSKNEKKRALESKWQKKYAELTVKYTEIKAKLNEHEEEITRVKEKNNKIKQLEDLNRGLANQLNNVKSKEKLANHLSIKIILLRSQKHSIRLK